MTNRTHLSFIVFEDENLNYSEVVSNEYWYRFMDEETNNCSNCYCCSYGELDFYFNRIHCCD